jgi:ornithine carbamoyltransferase
LAIYDIRGKDFISTQEWDREELEFAIDFASDIKRWYYGGALPELFKNKTFFMLFYNTSTRTRSSFEAAATMLGGHAQFIDFATTRGSEGERIGDIARMYERLGHALGVRILENAVDYVYGAGDAIIREYAKHSKTPVINMADDMFHPTQALADMMVIKEKFQKRVEGKKYTIMWAYSDHLRSWGSIQDEMLIASKFGMDVTMAYPEGFDIDEKQVEAAKENAAATGAHFEISHDPKEALDGADIVFPRSWTSHACVTTGLTKFGKDKEVEAHNKHKDWILNQELVDIMSKQSIITHVLPVLRGQEATDEVMDGPHSVILDQAENLLYARASVLALLAGNSR